VKTGFAEATKLVCFCVGYLFLFKAKKVFFNQIA